MVGKACRSLLPNILEHQSWLGRFLMALPDQLATQVVLLADERYQEVPAESDLVQGVGHELHPGAFRSHPGQDGAITIIPLGVQSAANQLWKQLKTTTSNEAMETD